MKEQGISKPAWFILFATGVPIFTVVNYFWSWFTDFKIAAALGGYRTYTDGRWTEIGDISWTFSSLLGVGMSFFSPAVGIILMPIVAGATLSLLTTNLVNGCENPLGKYYWILWSTVLLWVVRIPVPLEYSLFYWTAVRY